ncbi:hypothetical protein J6590_060172 [Homalodisca vitripennis]|nr:hypothetical protein J6590_060172 [Homalodisca vitripennis]
MLPQSRLLTFRVEKQLYGLTYSVQSLASIAIDNTVFAKCAYNLPTSDVPLEAVSSQIYDRLIHYSSMVTNRANEGVIQVFYYGAISSKSQSTLCR